MSTKEDWWIQELWRGEKWIDWAGSQNGKGMKKLFKRMDRNRYRLVHRKTTDTVVQVDE